MARLVLFSVSGLCLALVGVGGLAAYTAARLPDGGVVVVSAPANLSWQVKPMSTGLRPGPRTHGCAAGSKRVA
jgi:hypothetical protein